jgi:chromosome segregation ATPase
MASSRLQVEKSPLQMKQRSVCSFCHNVLDPNALFCDICGTPHDISQVYQVRSEMQQSVDSLNVALQSLDSQRAALLKEIELSEGKKRALADTLHPLTTQVESLTNMKRELSTEIESLEGKKKSLADTLQPLTIQVESLTNMKRELSTEIESLTTRIQQAKHRTNSRVRKNGRPPKALHNRKGAGGKVTHTFIGRYDGKDDWNAELAKRVAQFGLSLNQTDHSVSSGQIVFCVTGSRENIEKLSNSLTSMEGFVNLRSKLAELKRNLREIISARNLRQEQLETLERTPWYKRERTRPFAAQKAELTQAIAADDQKIRSLNENLKALENVLGGNAPTSIVAP